MQIVCNGKKETIKNKMTLESLLNKFMLDPDTIVVEVNKKIIEKDDYKGLQLQENDQIELIRFVGGG